jgi:MFS family permease
VAAASAPPSTIEASEATSPEPDEDPHLSGGWRDTFSALRIRNYRLFALSQLVANTGVWMQRVAQDWLVLELTGNVAMVGMTVAMQFAPMLFFGLFGGVIADRYPKRRLLVITQSSASALAGLLAILTLLHVTQAWHVYLIAIALGLVTVIDNPARQVFVNELVGPAHLRNAISVNSSIFQIGGLAGPALSGALIHLVGEGCSFAINSVACAVVVVTIIRIRPEELFHAPIAARAKGQLREGLRYVRERPPVFWTLVLMGFVAVFGMNMPVLLAAFASSVFGLGAGGYGLFNSLVAVGALAGALASARSAKSRLRGLVAAALVYGLLQASSALSPDLFSFAAVLIGVGLSVMVFLVGANSMVQMTTSMAVRGRVMSLYVLVQLGGQALGGLLMGRICEHLGPRLAMLISGLVPALAAVGIAAILAHTGRLTVRVNWPGAAGGRHLGRYICVVTR